MKSRNIWIIWMIIGGLMVSSPAFGRQIVKVPKPGDSLENRFDWALKVASGNGDFFVGYSVSRLMGEHSSIHCGNFHDDEVGATLEDILAGKEDVKRAVKKETPKTHKHKKKSTKKVEKDVAILFRYKAGAKKRQAWDAIVIHNTDSTVRLEEGNIYWLGNLRQDPSVMFLLRLFRENSAIDAREHLITAISLHDKSPKVVPFLKKTLTGDLPDKLRESAAFWLGNSQAPEAVSILSKVAVDDRSQDVREKAVFGLYMVESEAAVDSLIRLARKAPDTEVRKKAIFWLGQKAAKKSAAVLGDIVQNDSETDIQKSAIFALSQLPDGEGVSRLIKIAETHRSLAVRKKALFWLGQSEDSRALKLFESILKK